MGENFPRGLDSRRHEECRPIYGVEPQYILPDEVDVCGPVSGKGFVVVGIAHAGEVVRQGIEPDVDHVPGTVGYGDPP